MAEFGIFVWIAVIFAGFLFVLYLIPIGLWITATFSGVNVNLLTLMVMRFRKVPPFLIVQSLILANKAGIQGITSDQLETHYLAKGNLTSVIKALIMADKANIQLNYKNATAIDLAGRDVLAAVRLSVTPYVIVVPSVIGVSSEGIQLLTDVRVTVRANINQLVGGAGEETIKARVGQGIISAIGKASSYLSILGNPENISRDVLANGLDSGTAYTILSIDIADINVGQNIGAALQIDQANADLHVAKAKAEKRRAMAIATEQEMIAKAQEARAMVIQALSQIPVALAGAFRSGTLIGNRNP
jgi:uncharacterized protein YqfA (UPF0365 family)